MKNILLLEPDKKIVKVLRAGLKIDDVKIFCAQDSQSAILIADKNQPDLVIVELAISDQNGLAFLHEFRSYSEWSKVPVIIHSNLLIEKDLVLKIKKGLDIEAIFYKPQTSLKSLKISVLEALNI